MKRKMFKQSASLLAACSAIFTIGQLKVSAEDGSPKNDFYQYVNKEWLDKTKIPSDSPSFGASDAITDKIDSKLKKNVKNLASGK